VASVNCCGLAFRGEDERRELSHPVVALSVELAGEIEQGGVARSVVEPQYADHFVGPSEYSPLFKWLRLHGAQLVREIATHERNHAFIADGLLILCEHFLPLIGQS
jgi:hypothetical protein